jgi:gliding motility-associated-like protein
VINDNGCVSTTTIQDYICVEGYPVADFTVDPGELTNLNNTAQFSNNSSGASTYEWQFGDGGTSTITNPEHTYPATDDDDFIVQLIAYSDYGCPDTSTTILPLREELIFYVPNTFTPDNDDYNETFKPVFTAGFDPFNYQLLIFNRWGEVIFESNNAEIGWDGTYGADNQDLVKDGTYVWKIVFKTKYKDERQVEIGHVNVLK